MSICHIVNLARASVNTGGHQLMTQRNAPAESARGWAADRDWVKRGKLYHIQAAKFITEALAPSWTVRRAHLFEGMSISVDESNFPKCRQDLPFNPDGAGTKREAPGKEL